MIGLPGADDDMGAAQIETPADTTLPIAAAKTR